MKLPPLLAATALIHPPSNGDPSSTSVRTLNDVAVHVSIEDMVAMYIAMSEASPFSVPSRYFLGSGGGPPSPPPPPPSEELQRFMFASVAALFGYFTSAIDHFLLDVSSFMNTSPSENILTIF
jgi:hypothetical protein